jgi:hypothetical protein
VIRLAQQGARNAQQLLKVERAADRAVEDGLRRFDAPALTLRNAQGEVREALTLRAALLESNNRAATGRLRDVSQWRHGRAPARHDSRHAGDRRDFRGWGGS